MTDYYEEQISKIVDGFISSTNYLSVSESDDIIKEVIKEYPLLHYYISGGEFSGFTAKEIPHAIAEELRSYMRWYIFRRILWCLGFVLVSAFCVIKSMSRTRRHAPSNLKRTINYDNF